MTKIKKKDMAIAVDAMCERSANTIKQEDWEQLLETDDVVFGIEQIDELIEKLKDMRLELQAAKAMLEAIKELEESNGI